MQAHAGFFERAEGGTLFLDEITEMPGPLQVYLLRVLESRAVTRVGGAREVAVDVRVIAATNRDPADAVARGVLRGDLYYRLADFPIELAPLRSVATTSRRLRTLPPAQRTLRRTLPDRRCLRHGSYSWPAMCANCDTSCSARRARER